MVPGLESGIDRLRSRLSLAAARSLVRFGPAVGPVGSGGTLVPGPVLAGWNAGWLWTPSGSEAGLGRLWGRLACFLRFFSFLLRRLLTIFGISLEIFIGAIWSIVAEHTQGIGMK